MKKSFVLPTLVIIIALIFTAAWYFFLRDGVVLANRLKTHIANSTEINMREITPFEWDRVYVFEPYSTKQYISGILGFESSVSGPLYDEQQLLIFVRNSKVINTINFPRYSPGADFLPENSYSPDEAIFILNGGKLIKK